MVETLAASKVDLARFTRAIGTPPWQYALEARMETASRLLRDTSLPIPDIAFIVGYEDPPQFRRIFRKWSGQLTPSEYRARSREVVARVGPPREDGTGPFLLTIGDEWSRLIYQAVEVPGARL